MAQKVLLQDFTSAGIGTLKGGTVVDDGEARYTQLLAAGAPFAAYSSNMDAIIAAYQAQSSIKPPWSFPVLSTMLSAAGLLPDSPAAVLDVLAANEDPVDFNAQLLSNVADPEADQDVVTKAYLEANTAAPDAVVTPPEAAVVVGTVPLFGTVEGDALVGSLVGINAGGRLSQPATLTAPATVGAQIINKPLGSVNFAAAAQSLVVTCDQCTVNSLVFPTVMTEDDTAISCIAIPGAGSFELILNAAATAETRVGFQVING